MSDKIVMGTFDAQAQASQVVDRLLTARFSTRDITIFGAEAGQLKLINWPGKFRRSTEVILTICALTGAFIGTISGFYMTVASGPSSMVIASPLLAAFCGAAAGLCLGLLFGAIMRFDSTTPDTHELKKSIPEGRVVVAVRTHNRDMRFKAEELMDEFDPIDVDVKSEELTLDS